MQNGRSEAFIDFILADVKKVWMNNPEWRLGQLMQGALYLSEVTHEDLFYVEDTGLIENLQQLDCYWNMGG